MKLLFYNCFMGYVLRPVLRPVHTVSTLHTWPNITYERPTYVYSTAFVGAVQQYLTHRLDSTNRTVHEINHTISSHISLLLVQYYILIIVSVSKNFPKYRTT